MEQIPDWLLELFKVGPIKVVTIPLDDISKDPSSGEIDYYPEIISPTKIYSCPTCEILFSAPSQKELHMKFHESNRNYNN